MEPKDPGDDTCGGSLEQDSHDEIKEAALWSWTLASQVRSQAGLERKKQTGLQQEESSSSDPFSFSEEPGEGNSRRCEQRVPEGLLSH